MLNVPATKIAVETVPAWKAGEGEFVWPRDVVVIFPNGEEWNHEGGYDADGASIDYTPEGTGAVGSPCHQILVAHGYNV